MRVIGYWRIQMLDAWSYGAVSSILEFGCSIFKRKGNEQ